MKIEFKEEQKISSWWLWLLLILLGILPIVGIYYQLILGKQFGNNPISDIGLIIMAVLMFALIGMFYFFKLITDIDSNEIRINFVPLKKKTIQWNEVKTAEVINYGFVGGWGIRLWTKYGTVYNAKGNIGLALELKSGKKILIGTQKESDLKLILEQLNIHK